MLKSSLQRILFYLFTVILIFFLDRVSKIYIVNLAELNKLPVDFAHDAFSDVKTSIALMKY